MKEKLDDLEIISSYIITVLYGHRTINIFIYMYLQFVIMDMLKD
jgi:hypothetical protein